MIQKVFLDDLPRGGLNRGDRINWEGSVGHKVKFIYDDNEGWVEIVDYKNIEHGKIIVKYLDDYFEIDIQNFKKGNIGKILGKVTIKFKVEIGQTFKDDKRDLTITDREYRIRYKKNGDKCNDKYYKYKCNKCGNEDWIYECNLLKEIGCNVCCYPPQKVSLGINTIWDKARWMCDLGVSEEDAKTHTYCGKDKIEVICPDCGIKKQIAIYQIHTNKSISCTCGDGGKYPQKLMFSVLGQLDFKFKTEFAPKWCRFNNLNDINKIKTGRYDFLLEGYNIIIETDGEWHGKDNLMSGQTKEESMYIDNMKDKLALQNGYEVIRVDCCKSELEFIKQNILKSKLNELFNLTKVDWNKCEEFALSNRIKEACNYKKENPNITTVEIGKIMKLAYPTIIRYLKQGTKLGWCNYDAREELIKGSKKAVKIFKDGILLGIFPSCGELEKQSEELFGVKLNYTGIHKVITGKSEYYKNFVFEYVK